MNVIHPWDNFPVAAVFLRGTIIPETIMQATNHPKGNFLWGQLSRGKLSIIFGATVRLPVIRGTIVRAGNNPGGNLSGDNYPGVNFPRKQLSGHVFSLCIDIFSKNDHEYSKEKM